MRGLLPIPPTKREERKVKPAGWERGSVKAAGWGRREVGNRRKGAGRKKKCQSCGLGKGRERKEEDWRVKCEDGGWAATKGGEEQEGKNSRGPTGGLPQRTLRTLPEALSKTLREMLRETLRETLHETLCDIFSFVF